MSLADRITGAKSAITSLSTTERGLRDEHGQCLVERRQIIQAVPPRARILARVRDEIAAVRRAWIHDNGQALAANLGGSLRIAMSGAVEGVQHGSVLSALGSLDPRTSCALLPDALLAGITKILEEVDYPEGPPLEDRPPMIAKLDKRIAAIEDAHSELVDQAKVVGIEFPLLEEVRSRRAAAAHQRALDEHRAADLRRKIRA